MKHIFFKISLLLIIIGMPTHASSQILEFYGDEVRGLGTAGNASNNIVTLKIRPNRRNPLRRVTTGQKLREGLGKIEVLERKDSPCHVKVRYHSMGSSQSALGTGSWADCSNNDNKKKGKSGSAKSAEVAVTHVAIKVKVCLHNGKVKGVELTGKPGKCLVAINPEHLGCNPSADISSGYFERTNCPGSDSGSADNDWGTLISRCVPVASGLNNAQTPTGMIGVELHLIDQGNRRYVSGIRAICKKVRIRQ